MSQARAEQTAEPDLAARVRAAQAEIARAVQLGGLQNDPLRHALAALSTHLGASLRIAEDFRSAAGTGARGLTPDGEAALVRRVAERAAFESRQAVTAIAGSLKVGVIVAAVLAGGGLAGGGFLAGRWTAEQQVRLADDAAFMTQIAEVNAPRDLRAFCEAHPGVKEGGWQTCMLPPVWTHSTGQSKKAAAQ